MFVVSLQIVMILSVSTIYAKDLMSQGTILLNDGNRMPMISFGTFGKIELADKVVKPSVIEAIEAGYRQIDTAAVYENEEYIGEAIIDVINRGIVTREELWITTKLQPNVGSREGVPEALQAALKRLKLDYVDLFLIHTPDNTLNLTEHDISDIWKGMEDVKKLNLTRSIGVSNFNSTHINRILANSKTIPAVDEIEVNPTYANLELVAYCQSVNITVLVYAPFGFMLPRPFSLYPVETNFLEPTLVHLAQKYDKIPSHPTAEHIPLSPCRKSIGALSSTLLQCGLADIFPTIDRGMVPIPRSNNATHIRTNIDVFDFQLTPEEIYSINELNRNAKVYIFEGESLIAMIDYYGLNV